MSERPVIVTILAILYYVLGAIFELLGLMGLIAAFAAGAIGDIGLNPLLPNALVASLGIVGAGILAAAIYVPTGLIWLILGWGLWGMRPWSRPAAIIVAAITAVVSVGLFLWGIFIPSPTLIFLGIIWVILSLLVIYYFLLPNTRIVFERVAAGPVRVSQGGRLPGGGYVSRGPREPEERYAPRGSREPEEEEVRTRRQQREDTTPAGVTQRFQAETSDFAHLVQKTGARKGNMYKLGNTTNIGRNSNSEIPIPEDSAVSGQHARIRSDNGQYWIHDMASTNGTFVNDQQITKQALADHDTIKVGNTVFEFLWTKK
ncbi:MAG: FHA domain-containing protein [Chloroflexi bacterium]|nr:FHA domain-containing protein [Chloroflexota bacterium]